LLMLWATSKHRYCLPQMALHKVSFYANISIVL
jgi:hypothetical protein